MSLDIPAVITMVDKVRQLVEALPDYQHSFYVSEDLAEKIKGLGYISKLKMSGLNMYYVIDVSKNSQYKDKLSYTFGLTDKYESIFAKIEYSNMGVFNVITPPLSGGDICDAFQGYNESITTLPEIYDKIITILYGDIPVYVQYIYHRESTIKMSRKSEKLS